MDASISLKYVNCRVGVELGDLLSDENYFNKNKKNFQITVLNT